MRAHRAHRAKRSIAAIIVGCGVAGAVVCGLGLAAGTASASPAYSVRLDDDTRAQARAELLKQARTADLEPKAVDAMLKFDVVATSSDKGCPDVDVDVINATPQTMWNVEIEIEQKESLEHRTDHIHLPYLVTNTMVHVRVPCITQYRYSAGGGIELGYSAKSSRTLDEALSSLRTTKADYARQGRYVVPEVSATGQTLLANALELQDVEVASELVLGIAKTGVGVEELGAALSSNAEGVIANEVAGVLSKAPPATQAALARVLLASPSAGDWKDQLLPLINGRLCRGRAEAVQLWLQAQNDRELPDAELRDRVRAKCKLTAGDAPLVVAALAREPGRAGEVLDAVDAAMFDRAIAAWKTKHGDDANALYAYLRDGNDPARFDRAVAAIPAADLARAIAEVAKAQPGQVTPHKAAWITASLDKVAELDAVVRGLTEELVKGEIVADPMREAARLSRDRAPAAAGAVMVDYANQHSTVFAADKLGPGIDAGEFLAFATGQLGNCSASLDALRACANAIAAYKGGALAKLAGTAVRPDFTAKLPGLVSGVDDVELAIALAGELRAAGLGSEAVADHACDKAKIRSDPEPWLTAVTKIDPAAPCLVRLRDELVARHHKVIWLTLFAIVGLVAPFPAGGLVMRRRYRKLQSDLPAVETDETPKGEKLADRLGAQGLGRGLRAGVAAAARELAGSAVAQAIAAVEDPVLEAAGEAVGRAVRSGDAASVIIRRAEDAVYVVALPVRHPRPQVVERYLGAPWPEHLASIQRAAGSAVLALVVLCGPEAGEAQLLVGFAPPPGDPRPASDPEALLDAQAARERGANQFRHVMPLAATPSNSNEA